MRKLIAFWKVDDAVRILIDTQVMVYAYTDVKALSPKAMRVLEAPQTIRLISAISILEIAIKHEAGKITMGSAEVEEAIRDLRLQVMNIKLEHAMRMYSMPLHHRDPFERTIIATALSENIPLVGSDREFRKYREQGLNVIW